MEREWSTALQLRRSREIAREMDREIKTKTERESE